MGLIPKTTHAENKMGFGLNMNTFMGVVMALLLGSSLGSSYVHAYFRLPFMLFCVGIYLYMNRPAPQNPKKKIWQGFYLWIRRLTNPAFYLCIIGYAYKEHWEVMANG